MTKAKRSNARTRNEPQNPSSLGSNTSVPSSSSGSIPILRFENQAAWEAWLEDHHTETSGAWLQIAKKDAENPTVTYDEAVDAALCFGWIDGQAKTHDAQHYIRRFTPRRKGSLWSKRNVDKVSVLTESGRMRPSGQAEVDAAKADGRWARAYSAASVQEVPLDFQAALEGNEEARRFFEALNKTQRYTFLWRIETVKRAETRRRKIGEFVGLLAEHKTL
ncbi:hypothetical protein CPLU01_12644 [Colletotrichum plurivorum]|uniref:Bacteriocin-protection protein n=1 Tax=Colletotrichum plurivorum TaxID=2175906 RepID=A0A8H6JWV2_9PEZI|nr:hypothetical protein CPLU01_12644 [Colletotrichum plurivorum]